MGASLLLFDNSTDRTISNTMDQFLNWISGNYIELTGAVLGVVYVFLSIRQSIFTWPVGLLTSVFYVWIFLESKLYADMGLQLYYVVISIYGWSRWLNGNPESKNTTLKVSRVGLKLSFILTLVSTLLFALIWFILKNFTDSTVPVADALATALSIVATWMLARKILEHWLVWIFVDAFSIGLFWYKNLMPTVVLFFIYTVMAVVGYIEWKRDFLSDKSSNLTLVNND
jgi:nicotinamide mononucleotide transporter